MEFEKNYVLLIKDYQESYFFDKNILIPAFSFKAYEFSYNLKNNNYNIKIKNRFKNNPFFSHKYFFYRFLKYFKNLKICPLKLTFYLQKLTYLSKKIEKVDFVQTTILETFVNNEKISFYYSFPSSYEIYKTKILLNFFLNDKLKILNDIPRNLPILFGMGCAGVLFHEIIAHPLEGDVFKDSFYRNKIGEKVAKEDLTVFDDPLYNGLCLRRKFDDEGEVCFKKVLIEKGIVKNLLCNNIFSKILLFPPGNGRISLQNPIPSPRSYNTIVDGVKENKISFNEIYPNFLYIPIIKKASFIPPDKVRVLTGPLFYYFNGKIYGKINSLLIEEKVSKFLSNIDFIGEKIENCMTFGTCTKDGGKVFTGSASPILSFINISYKL